MRLPCLLALLLCIVFLVSGQDTSSASTSSVVSDVCVDTYPEWYSYNIGSTPRQNDDLYYCTWYQDKTCCRSAPTLKAQQLSRRYEMFPRGDYSNRCQYYYQLVQCRFCNPDFGIAYETANDGTGKRIGVCKEYIDDWYEACKDIMGYSRFKYSFTNDEGDEEYIERAYADWTAYRIGESPFSSARSFYSIALATEVPDVTQGFTYDTLPTCTFLLHLPLNCARLRVPL